MKLLWSAAVVKYHRALSWLGGVALLCWVLSGLLHPLMTWTGPRAVQFFPPRMALSELHLQQAGQALARYQQTEQAPEAGLVRLVPYRDRVLLQLTLDGQQPRRYLDLQSGTEQPGHDREQAIWLARYYTGLADAPVAEVHWQTTFSDDYPPVNRLLPVYRVRFATDDNRTAWVYTELNALSAVSNDYKNVLQAGFRWLHTWSWLDGYEGARVLLMALLLVSAMATLVAGIMLLKLLRQRRIHSAARRWHRYLAWLVALPLLAFTTSGFYHLLHNAGGADHQAIQLPAPGALPHNISFALPEELPADSAFHAASLVQGPDGRWLWRLGVSVAAKGAPGDSQRYRGVAVEQAPLLLDAVSGQPATMTDEQLAWQIAARLRPELADAHGELHPVTRFDHHYDFRNKRLPVWAIHYHNDSHSILFVDTAAGLIVDSSEGRDHREHLSFSVLHKWNPLTPLTGRFGRDLLIVGVLLLTLTLTVLGFVRLVRRR